MRTVACTIEINGLTEKIIKAFTDSEMLKGWWGLKKSFIELKPGSIYTLIWFVSENGVKYISTDVIKKYILWKKITDRRLYVLKYRTAIPWSDEFNSGGSGIHKRFSASFAARRLSLRRK